MKNAHSDHLRRWQVGWRETRILFREFRTPLLVFLAAILGLGILYFYLARVYSEPLQSLPESIFLILSLAFLQSSGSFPHAALLQVFYFVMPVIGVACAAQGLADFGGMLFNRRSRSKEWEMAVASTFKNHTILVGLGHLGYRVAGRLHAMRQEVVVIEKNPSADMVSAIQKMGIPIIKEDATHAGILESAGVAKARTIILCTQNDSLNLQIAVRARSLDKDVRVVIRIFDDDFAQALKEQFGFIALSGTGMAAPVFAAAAAGADISSPIMIEGNPLSLAHLVICAGSLLEAKTVGEIEDAYHLSIISVRHDHRTEMHPTDSLALHGGDNLVVLGGVEPLNLLLHDNA